MAAESLEKLSLPRKPRSRSFSVGSRQDDLQLKYWTLLFENLQRSVDEIYSVCEAGQHVEECKEVITRLETYVQDFKSLRKWLQVKQEVDSMPAVKRRGRYPWETRKSAVATKLQRFKSTTTTPDAPNITTAPQEPSITTPNPPEVNPDPLTHSTLPPLPLNYPAIPLSLPPEEKKMEEKSTPSILSSENSTASFDTTVTKIKMTVQPSSVKAEKPVVTSKYSHVVNKNAGMVSPVTVKKPIVKKLDTGMGARGVKPLLKQLKSSINSTTRLAQRTSTEKREPAVLPRSAPPTKPVTAKPVSALKEQQRRFGVSVEDLPSNATGVYEEGSHGWEMVRGRPRLKNSPPKTLFKDRSASQSFTDLPHITPRAAPSIFQRAKTTIAPFIPRVAQRVSPQSADASKVRKVPSRTVYEKTPSFRTDTVKKRPVPHQEGSKTLPRQKKPLIRMSPKVVRKVESKEKVADDTNQKVSTDTNADLAVVEPKMDVATNATSIDNKEESETRKEEIKVEDEQNRRRIIRRTSDLSVSSAKTEGSGKASILDQEGIDFKAEVLIPILVCESVTPTSSLSREASSSALNQFTNGNTDEKIAANQCAAGKEGASEEPKMQVLNGDGNKELEDPCMMVDCLDAVDIGNMRLGDFIRLSSPDKQIRTQREDLPPTLTNKSPAFLGVSRDLNISTNEEVVSSRDKGIGSSVPEGEVVGAAAITVEATNKEAFEEETRSGLATPRDDESLLDEQEMHEHDLAWENALFEEACLHQQMMEAEGTDTDTDPDDTSTIASSGEDSSLTSSQPQLLYEGMSWSEEVEFEQDRDMSHISRAFEVHEKLSSPARRRVASPDEAFRQIEERQARASRLRKQLFEDKAVKRKDLQKKIDEVKEAKDRLAEQKRHLLERKMKRADEKRQCFLADIVRKAHDEEQKLRELAFINELEAQNKRLDFMTSCQCQEDRLHILQEERLRRNEEKAAKDAAVEERKKALEAERHEKVMKLQERRRRKEEKIDRENQEKAKQKGEQIREKQRDRQERLSALQAAHLATLEELQKKIQQKQEEYARRHDENIEQIKNKASELAVPRFASTPEEAPLSLALYEKKRFCNLCNVMIASEIQLLSHVRGRIHQEALKSGNLSESGADLLSPPYIVEASNDMAAIEGEKSKEIKKTYAKRLKKLRSRMLQRSDASGGNNNNEKNIPENVKKSRVAQILSNICRINAKQTVSQWEVNAITQVERSADELLKIMAGQTGSDQSLMQTLGGFQTLAEAFFSSLPENSGESLTKARCSENLLFAMRRCLVDNFQVTAQVLIGSPPLAFVDLLVRRLEPLLLSHNSLSAPQLSIVTTHPSDSLTCGILSLISTMLNSVALYSPCIPEKKNLDMSEVEFFLVKQQTADFISYLLCSGVVDWISVLCSRCQCPLEGDIETANLLAASFRCLHAAVDCLFIPIVGTKKSKNSPQDTTGLLDSLKDSEVVGIISTLYGILLHQGALSRGNQSPIRHSGEILAVVSSGIRLLICFARLDLKGFQTILSTEGISLQFRHISSHLLRFCGRDAGPSPLLDNLIICIGYFAIGHVDNQTIIQSGQQPSVLQQLCQLPFIYFSDPARRLVLFPTLLACSIGNPENKTILEQEMNYQKESKTLQVILSFRLRTERTKKFAMQLDESTENIKTKHRNRQTVKNIAVNDVEPRSDKSATKQPLVIASLILCIFLHMYAL